jgi:hypothetical protein
MGVIRPASSRRQSVYGALALAGTLSLVQPAQGAEYGQSLYLLGLSLPMAGYTPPPGVFLSSTMYLYNGSVGNGIRFPFGRSLDAGINEKFLVNATTISWFLPTPILGGTFGLAATVPFGKVDVSADASFGGPLLNAQGSRSDSTTGFGEPAFSAILGWHQGNNHWSVTATGFAPAGAYSADALANVSVNRPGVDIKGAYTWLDMMTGLELSGAVGMTFNMANTATDYTTGTEFRVEGAINQHLASGFTFGAGGYFYQQISDDGGSGDIVGPFRGRVAAIGPLIGDTFKLGEIPVTVGARWFHEFNTDKRVFGDSVFATLSMPLFVYPQPKPAPNSRLLTKAR